MRESILTCIVGAVTSQRERPTWPACCSHHFPGGVKIEAPCSHLHTCQNWTAHSFEALEAQPLRRQPAEPQGQLHSHPDPHACRLPVLEPRQVQITGLCSSSNLSAGELHLKEAACKGWE